jgi:general stress protein YciG
MYPAEPSGGEATLNSLSTQVSQTNSTVNEIKSKLEGDISSKIADIHKEATKAPVTEWLEAAGLDGVAAGVEKIKEGEGFKVFAPYFASALSGLLIPAIGLLMLANFRNFQRMLQGGILNGVSRITGGRFARNQILAMNDGGTFPRLQDRDQVRTREESAGGLGSLANPPNASTLQPLRDALADLNPKIREFNREARELPNARSLAKTAESIEGIKAAVTGVDTAKITQTASALNQFDRDKIPDPRKLDKVNKAMNQADPNKMQQVAKAGGKLVGAQRHLDPERWRQLPKASTLSSAAKSAERLAKAGGQVAQAFNSLKNAARDAAAAI